MRSAEILINFAVFHRQEREYKPKSLVREKEKRRRETEESERGKVQREGWLSAAAAVTADTRVVCLTEMQVKHDVAGSVIKRE